MDAVDRITEAIFPFAAGWFLALMALRTTVVLRRGYKVDLGLAKGSPRRGVLYSLTFSMLPWKKDSSRLHPWTYAAGMGMHLGIFVSVILALGLRWLEWAPWVTAAGSVVAGTGFVCTLGLFLKRAFKPYMRAISNADDYLSNLLVQLYLIGGCVALLDSSLTGFWRLGAVLLLIYIPLGKIYHMVLFFVSRVLFGLRFGRRGVLRHDVPVSY